MLAKIAPATNDFHALARYLVNGKSTSTTNPIRVAWSMGYNLPDDDPELAAKIMSATAEMSPRTKKAAYHVMIAWHQREKPTPEVMQKVAVKTLELAGLGEHQALIMGHGDRPHKHVHMAINRVNPETGRAWKTSHDYARLDRIMEQLSDQYGFAYVPAHTYNPELTADDHKKPNSAATYAGKRGANTKRPQWSKCESQRFSNYLTNELDSASTWDDLENIFEENDLRLEEKGRGHIVGNDESYTKFSSLRLPKTAKGFTKRPQTLRKRKPDRRPIFTVDAVDITRALVTAGIADKSAIREAVDDAIRDRSSRKSVIEQLLHNALGQTVLTPAPQKKSKQVQASSQPRKRKSSRHSRR